MQSAHIDYNYSLSHLNTNPDTSVSVVNQQSETVVFDFLFVRVGAKRGHNVCVCRRRRPPPVGGLHPLIYL